MALQNISYIPLEQAVRKYGVSKNVLRQKAESGKLEVIETVNGDLLVADNNIDPSLNIKRKDFEHLRGRKISMSEASRMYNVPQVNFSRWTKSGFITILGHGKKRSVLLDEADVAYCAAVYKAKHEFYGGRLSGVSVFDKDGNPYQVKYREIAATMRAERRQKKRKAIAHIKDQ
jgi:predicted site-specific integrase-resolvase